MAQETDAQLQTRRATIENETTTGANTTARVGDMFENIIDSKLNIADYAPVTREFNRTFVEALVFDKNEIFHAPFTMTADINLEIGPGALVDQASAMRFRMTADGVHVVNFGIGFDFLYGISNGQILEAGTYEFYFLYTNGSVSVNVPGVTAQASSTIALGPVTDLVAVADGENAIDLSWSNISNNSGYLIEFSLTGLGSWTTLETTATNAVTSTQTGLSAGDIRYYRIKTLGDGVIYTDSAFSDVASGQTESAGDVTAPTFTYLPASGNTVWPINKIITITANEPIRNTNGTDITNGNVSAILILKQTNSGGSNIAFTATIDSTKQVITITPTTIYGDTQLVYVAINNVEDVNGNEVTVAISSTFTTTSYTYFDASSNYLGFGDILDTVWTISNAKFKLRLTVNNAILSGSRFLAGKYSSSDNQRCFYWYYVDTDVYFVWARSVSNVSRGIKWAGAMTSGEHDMELIYDGSINTNDGLDRCILNIDGSPAGSKTLFFVGTGGLTILPNSTSHLSLGTGVNNSGAPAFALYYGYEAKDFIVLSGAGDTVEINVPLLRTGDDTSGNNNDGTWV